MLMGGMNIINPALLPEETDDNNRILTVDACLSDKYQFDEAPKGNKCESHCDCDGLRTCSAYNWCQGTSRKEEIKKEEVKMVADIISPVLKSKIEELIGGMDILNPDLLKEVKMGGNDIINPKLHEKKSKGKMGRDGHGIWKKHSQKKNKKVRGGSHDNWKKHQKTHKKVETVPAPAPTPKKAYGAGSGGDWSI